MKKRSRCVRVFGSQPSKVCFDCTRDSSVSIRRGTKFGCSAKSRADSVSIVRTPGTRPTGDSGLAPSSTGRSRGTVPRRTAYLSVYADVIESDADELWIGGAVGAARRDRDGGWHYYQGEAWLPHDRVTSIAATPRRVLIGTARGLAVIERRRTTLAAKAAHFETVLRNVHTNRHGFVWEVNCQTPGDAATASESGYTR